MTMESLFDRLWPICRSITGPGYRESLEILSEVMPTKRLRFKTGRKVFDWTVPREWVARDAYFIGPDGRKRADFKKHNLHLVSYSVPFRGRLSLSELKAHLHCAPETPTAIPYLTSYYKDSWGFCLSHQELQSLPKGQYDVVVDTEIKPGHLEIGEAVLPGKTKREIFFHSYLCHPSLANNELSGPLVMAFLYRKIAALKDRRYTYRFAVMPETIGPICYLTARGRQLKKAMDAGFVMTCLGDPGSFTFKRSRRGGTLADRAAELVLRDLGPHEILPFDPSNGSDERQYGSPGFDLPVASLMRTMYGRYAEYHSSLDNKDFISFKALEGSVDAYFDIVLALEANRVWKNKVMYGEPQLGRRGLYSQLGGQKMLAEGLPSMFWLLNLADGTRDLLAIAERSGQPLKQLIAWTVELSKLKLLG